jgi:hypothetical protein
MFIDIVSDIFKEIFEIKFPFYYCLVIVWFFKIF